MAVKTKRFIAREKSVSCSMPGVWRAMEYCHGAVVVFHSPASCAHVARILDVNSLFRSMGTPYKEDYDSIPLLSSQLAEKDTIFGGVTRLEKCLEYVIETYAPRLIVIGCSCIAGVIGDDVVSVAAKVEKEYKIPVIPSESCGFLDGEYYEGYFEITTKLAERFFVEQEKEANSVLLLGDHGGPKGHYAQEVNRLLEGLGLHVIGQFPGYTAVDDLAGLMRAELSVVLGGRGKVHEGLVALAKKLHDKFAVDYMSDCYPVGWKSTREWIEAMGKKLGKEQDAAKLIAVEEENFYKELNEIRKNTAGKKTVLCIGRLPIYYNPDKTMETIELLQVDLQSVVLLNAYDETNRNKMLEMIKSCTDVPIVAADEADKLLKEAEIILTTHELEDRSLRQIFLPMLPLVGITGELRLMRAINRTAKSRIKRGGVVYV